jgi:hypothetical protein
MAAGRGGMKNVMTCGDGRGLRTKRSSSSVASNYNNVVSSGNLQINNRRYFIFALYADNSTNIFYIESIICKNLLLDWVMSKLFTTFNLAF